ncbi:MAG: hypothetical protein FJX76_19970 [Armatimonadetes bacterium]|nr:hypothetical protein [Armatimonadota bacterium]
MLVDLSARRLEQEVDAIICAALKVGLDEQVVVNMAGHFNRTFTVDRILTDDFGYPSEVWLSAPAGRSFMDILFGRVKRTLLRVSRLGGDVRRSVSVVSVNKDNTLKHLSFREDVGAPRISRSVATFRYPNSDGADWMLNYARAS